MAVKEEQPETPAPSERKCRSEEDAAIAAQDERESSEAEGESHAIGKAESERADAFGIEDASGLVSEGNIGWDGNAAGVANVGKPLQKANRAKNVWETIHAGAA